MSKKPHQFWNADLEEGKTYWVNLQWGIFNENNENKDRDGNDYNQKFRENERFRGPLWSKEDNGTYFDKWT